VQNYTRDRYDSTGPVSPPPGAAINQMHGEIYPPSLGGAVRYAYAATGRPLLVTEHGIGHREDSVRAAFIEPALTGLLDAIEDGVPVLGYLHWSLLDNFEWIFGYDVKFGLHEVDRGTFARTAKPSAGVYAAIARANAIG
jgi:beta-glucosidase